MTDNNIHHLCRLAGQLSSALFYIRNAYQVAQGAMLFHKEPGRDSFLGRTSTEEQAHATIQSLLRQIEQQSSKVPPAGFEQTVAGMRLMYLRIRSQYVLENEDRTQWLVGQPAPNRVDVPTMPVREKYVGNYDDFYREFFAETVAQIDAYHWMCQLEKYAARAAEMDMPEPFMDTTSPHDWGWLSIEPTAYSLMRTFISNQSDRNRVCQPLAEYGTQVALQRLAVLSDRMELWIAEGVIARREKQQ